MVVIVFGLPGSGKSFFASRLASMINAYYIKSDRVRKEMLKKRNYSVKEKLSVYNAMLSQLIEAKKQNKNIVVDATFYKNEIRRNFINKAPANDSILFIEVIADESLIRERLKKTREDSEADFEVYKKIKEEWEQMDEPHLVLKSTDENINEMLLKTTDYLQIKDDTRTNK
jgi:predicted kinase